MATEFFLDRSDELTLTAFDSGALNFAIEVAYKLGMAIGYQYGKESPDSRSLDDYNPRFTRLKASWEPGYFYGSVSVVISSNHEVQSINNGRIVFSGYDLLMFTDVMQGNYFEWKVLGAKDIPDINIRLLVVRVIDKRLRQVLRGIEFTNQYGLCQSGCCARGETLSFCHRVGNLWVCTDCEEQFMLNEPLPQLPDETPKEQTEREKMTASLRFDILVRDAFTCRACGRSPRKGDNIKLHVDHIKPIHHGGKTEPDNLQVLCQDCNLGKSAKWTRQIEMLFSSSPNH